ncbi:MAG: HIT family protein [Nanoarchaeota archaeon]|nr:HIT family protein [Nanoarchaeota archaeon]
MLSGKSKAQSLYEDDAVIVAVKDMAYTPGQITIFPRKHFTILEQVPDEIMARCLAVADKTSRAVFEVFQAEGTNILIQNGLGAGQKVPHFAIEVVPRREGDGLNLQWQPKEMSEDDLDITAHQLAEEIQKLGDFTAPKKKEEPKEKKEIKIEEKESSNYLVKSLRRIP